MWCVQKRTITAGWFGIVTGGGFATVIDSGFHQNTQYDHLKPVTALDRTAYSKKVDVATDATIKEDAP
jgi:hypothetical protein